MNIQFYIVFALELTAAISAAFYIYTTGNRRMLPILVLLWYTFLNEVFGLYYANNISNADANLIVHNIYDLLSFTILFYTLYKHISHKLRRKIILSFFSLFIFAEIGNLLYVGFDVFVNLTFAQLAGCVLITLSILYYGIDLLYVKNINHIGKNPLVWVSVAYLIYYVSNPFLLLTWEFVGEEASDSFDRTFGIIKFALIVLMYTIIITGFLWNRMKFKS